MTKPTALVAGANSGIGLETNRAIATGPREQRGRHGAGAGADSRGQRRHARDQPARTVYFFASMIVLSSRNFSIARLIVREYVAVM